MRSYLNGRFANTAFCLLSPDGKTRLSRGHRSPNQALGQDLAGSLGKIAAKYNTRGSSSEAAVPDFPNFRLGLNVASADQRPIVLITGSDRQIAATRKSLPAVSNDPEIIGRFHYDFETDHKAWTKIIGKNKTTAAIKIILPGTFGQEGKIIKSLPLTTKPKDLKAALLEANKVFAKTTDKKSYRTHVREGRRRNIDWTMPMEYGEDRDGDGKIDHRGGPRR